MVIIPPVSIFLVYFLPDFRYCKEAGSERAVNRWDVGIIAVLMDELPQDCGMDKKKWWNSRLYASRLCMVSQYPHQNAVYGIPNGLIFGGDSNLALKLFTYLFAYFVKLV
ncbi:hypothetical protein FACS189494_05930 [Spirochaetia bacterium]|nr:hypothetical protein FACS189494_05930 [Spirochaetia bacterium]